MKKKTLEQYLESNPGAKQHERMIRETLIALEELRALGFVDKRYELEPPYGGTRHPYVDNTRRIDRLIRKTG